MKKFIPFMSLLFMALMFFPTLMQAQDNQQLAFPGAEGYGKYTSGGRGGEVCYVTRLDDCTDNNLVKGTLRWAVRHPNGGKPRTILFKVSGTIYLTSKLRFAYPNVSILGQTAPGGGICLSGYNMYINQSNVIMRYVRFRAGDIPNASMTGLDVENCSNVILDHCSMTWSMEECLTAYDTKYTTVQWCIIGEGLYNSKNAKGARAYATQWGGEHSSMINTLITNSHSRSPRFNGARDAGSGHDTYVDSEFANNVVFNWSGTGAIYGGEMKSGVDGYNRVYMINNYYRPGPSTKKNNTGTYFASPSSPYGEWYANGNKFEETGTYSPWTAANAQKANSNNLSALNGLPDAKKLSELPYALSGMEYTTADVAFTNVTTKAGASLPRYDEVDARLLAEAAGKQAPQFTGSIGQAGIIDSPDDIKLSNPGCYYVDGTIYTNYPDLGMQAGDKYAVDTDGDGMPDAYEDEAGLNKNDAADGTTVTASGYTNLEVYLNAVADGTVNKSKYETSDAPDIAGTSQTLPATVDGKTYSGYIVGGVYYEVGKTISVPSGVTLTPLVTVTFDYTGVAAQTATTSTKITMPTATKQDYTFNGWTDGTNTYAAGTAYTFASCVTLTPVFVKQAGPVERALYSTDFTNWSSIASSTSANKKTVTTDYSNEQLVFTFAEVQVNPTGTNTKFTSPATTGYAMAAKSSTPYIETSALANITTVTFVHCATGSNRGWGLKVKGDGDSDWVTLSKAVANPAGGKEVTVTVNRANCKLRFYNLTSDQNAYMTNLTIKGKVNIAVTKYAFSAAATTGGTVTSSTTEAEVEKDAQVTVTAKPATGYLFDSWTDQNGKVLSTSETYTHTVTAETHLTANFKSYSDYAYITEDCQPYDAQVSNVSELKAALYMASKRTGTSRYRIFVHNGIYDLGSTAKTAIPQSTSLIGESQDGVLIMNTAPQVSSNYQDLTPTLFIDQNQNNVYIQDLTIRQARDWEAKKSQGQALAMRQRGKQAIYKNVTMQGIQDTYYLNKSDASAYFETCTMAGEVDFIYGDGAMFFQQCKLQPVSSGACITAPNTPAGNKGIVFNECTIEQEPSAKGNVAGYKLGRPWSDSPSATYINTTMNVLPNAAAWGSMTNGLVVRFHEYGSKDADGNLLDLSKRSIAACSAAAGSDAPVIDAAAAAEYTIANTFAKCAAGWTPAERTKQFTAPTPILDTTESCLSWTMVDGAFCYAIVKDGNVVGFTQTTSYPVTDVAAKYQIRVANSMGGLGVASDVAVAGTAGINGIKANMISANDMFYNLAGQRVTSSKRGIIIHAGKKIVNK